MQTDRHTQTDMHTLICIQTDCQTQKDTHNRYLYRQKASIPAAYLPLVTGADHGGGKEIYIVKKQTDTYTYIDRQTDRQADTHTHIDTQIDRHVNRQTDGRHTHMDRQTDRQTDR